MIRHSVIPGSLDNGLSLYHIKQFDPFRIYCVDMRKVLFVVYLYANVTKVEDAARRSRYRGDPRRQG